MAYDSPAAGEYRHVPWPVMAHSLWLRAAIVAAGVSVFGVSMIGGSAGDSLAGVALVVAGAAAAYGAWRRAGRALDGVDAAAPVPTRRVPTPPGLQPTFRT